MEKYFNITGRCNPQMHYMVELESRLIKIKKLIDQGAYFTINRARQYGKTTTLGALKKYLENNYKVISMDFQMLSHADFENENVFVRAFSSELLVWLDEDATVPKAIHERLIGLSEIKDGDLRLLFRCMSDWCAMSEKPIVLMIDEVDSATNNQIFMDFLAQLRGYYLHRMERPTFQSVILAGVYDVKNLKRKLRPEDDAKVNSPWNIATDFDVDMSFTKEDIAGMLRDYENDYHTGMEIDLISGLLYDYTSGYPFLVSRLCKLIDEEIWKKDENVADKNVADKKEPWTKEGFHEAVKMLLTEQNTLFESFYEKLVSYPELNDMLRSLLFTGKSIAYNFYEPAINIGTMFGFVKNENGVLMVANRIFDTWLYNLYLSNSEMQNQSIYKASLIDKNRFIVNGYLNMRMILERFVVHFNDLYGGCSEKFLEDEGRKYFLLYLRPIINGTGNYYIESQTRGLKRTDVIVDYQGEQFVVEMKIWHGNEYNTRGENQLVDYLEAYHTKKGYMVSFNFNKKKKIGVQEIVVGDKVLIEAVV